MDHSTLQIRNFSENDFSALGDFHKQVTEGRNIVFWWVGDQENWSNVFVAVEQGIMVAKGQVQTMAVLPSEAEPSAKHRIFFNIKTLPEREKDQVLLKEMYNAIHRRALELKKDFPSARGTELCFGNFVEEVDNTTFFAGLPAFYPLKRQYRMECELSKSPRTEPTLPAPYEWQMFDTLNDAQMNDYLALDTEIWPNSPTGEKRIREYMQNRNWRLLQIHHEGQPVASLMYWLAEDTIGEIEEVLVREPYRRKGLASMLLNKALHDLQAYSCEFAELDVEATNESALKLYVSAGFQVETEEHRYATEL